MHFDFSSRRSALSIPKPNPAFGRPFPMRSNDGIAVRCKIHRVPAAAFFLIQFPSGFEGGVSKHLKFASLICKGQQLTVWRKRHRSNKVARKGFDLLLG